MYVDCSHDREVRSKIFRIFDLIWSGLIWIFQPKKPYGKEDGKKRNKYASSCVEVFLVRIGKSLLNLLSSLLNTTGLNPLSLFPKSSLRPPALTKHDEYSVRDSFFRLNVLFHCLEATLTAGKKEKMRSEIFDVFDLLIGYRGKICYRLLIEIFIRSYGWVLF